MGDNPSVAAAQAFFDNSRFDEKMTQIGSVVTVRKDSRLG
jgi:hypothetical protein